MITQQKVTVIFDMWGQRCETIFDESSELDPYTWAMKMLDKGWMLPIEIVREDGIVLYTGKDLKLK